MTTEFNFDSKTSFPASSNAVVPNLVIKIRFLSFKSNFEMVKLRPQSVGISCAKLMAALLTHL